jgi:hypothetical protein
MTGIIQKMLLAKAAAHAKPPLRSPTLPGDSAAAIGCDDCSHG